MTTKVDFLFAAHRPMSDPVAPDRLVICSCDTETSRDLIAHSRHMIEVGIGPEVAAVQAPAATGAWARMNDEQKARQLLAASQARREGPTADTLLAEAQVHATFAVLDGLSDLQNEITRVHS